MLSVCDMISSEKAAELEAVRPVFLSFIISAGFAEQRDGLGVWSISLRLVTAYGGAAQSFRPGGV